VLLMDEPFAALDPPTRESVVNDLEKVLAETRTTTIMATHDRNEALRLSDRLAVMGDGRIAQVDRPGVVMYRPVNEFVASFVGTETILEGSISETTRAALIVNVNGSQFEVSGQGSPGDKVMLFIRPENVTVSVADADARTSARNTFHGVVARIVTMGFFCKVEISCGFPLVAYVTPKAVEELGLREGKGVTASIKATSIHYIRKGG